MYFTAAKRANAACISTASKDACHPMVQLAGPAPGWSPADERDAVAEFELLGR